MKKKIVIVALLSLCLCGCTSAERARSFGGTDTIELEAGQKLEEITWKEDTYWILTRDMRDDEKPENHIFYAKSPYGVFEGTVKIIEKE